MNNVYNDETYTEVKKYMHKKFKEVRLKYADSNTLDEANLKCYLQARGIDEYKSL